jgi:hypothetical protein
LGEPAKSGAGIGGRTWKDLLDLAGAQCGRLDGRWDDHHGDVVAVAEEDPGELRHGHDVANAGGGVQDDGLLHLLKRWFAFAN